MTREPQSDTPEGERIAKRLARAGVASRRAAETMIAEGRVSVNGRVIDSPALNVTARDRITVDGKPVAAAEQTRLWRYYKPVGLVTTESDEKGRDTVFAHLPEDMPRVMSVGRLDLNSEGLLLLTNDGELKRRLELPSTGWLRKYRVRAKGEATEAMLEPLRRGVTVEGERFQPMTVTLDRQQGANVWLTIGLREGRNREIRRALESVGLAVNRLIRLSYGPFQLGEMEPGAVEEVRPKILRDQLGLAAEQAAPADQGSAGKPGPAKPRTAKGFPVKGFPAKGPAAEAARKDAIRKDGSRKDAARTSAAAKAASGKPSAGKGGPGKPGGAGPGAAKPAGQRPNRPAGGPGNTGKPPRR